MFHGPKYWALGSICVVEMSAIIEQKDHISITSHNKVYVVESRMQMKYMKFII